MQDIGPEQLVLVVDRVVAAVRPERVYLFGSQAYGSPGEGSDIDVLVVVPDGCGDPQAVYAAAERSLRGLCLPVELVICTRSQFDRQKDWVSSVANVASRKGRLLYAA